MSARLTRRGFLALAAGGGLAALAAATRPWHALVASAAPQSAAERLASLIPRPESARPIGRKYLELVPAEASSQRLAALIVDAVGGVRSVAGASDDELRGLLAAGTVGDFGTGRTLELDGWVLSHTEARLYALVALA